MKRFLKNVLLFLAPLLMLLIALSPFYIVARSAGELSDIEECAVKQRNNPSSLLGMGYNEQNQYYKITNANYYKPDVIALGTSRVLQFRSDYFSKSFYNCGSGVNQGYDQYRNFLQNMEEKPEIVILGIDTMIFNKRTTGTYDDFDHYTPIRDIPRNWASILKSIIQDWFRGSWTFEEISAFPNNIGFNGRKKNAGFVSDGSYYYGYVYKRRADNPSIDEDFEDIRNRIKNGTGGFWPSEHMDKGLVDKLDGLLKYCKDNDMKVVGVITPYPPSIWSQLTSSGKYGFVFEVEPACRVLFNKYDYELYNYEDGAVLDLSDEYYLDGYHGGDHVYGCIVKDIIEKGSILSDYVDPEKLDSCLTKPYSKLAFWDIEL